MTYTPQLDPCAIGPIIYLQFSTSLGRGQIMVYNQRSKGVSLMSSISPKTCLGIFPSQYFCLSFDMPHAHIQADFEFSILS